MNRRQAIALLAGTLAAGWPAGIGSAEARRRTGGLVIDGNLVAPIDPDAPLDAAVAEQVRSSGLTAFKLTLGGSGNQDEAQTRAEIAQVVNGIALNPGLFARISTPSDLARARREGRIGVILSFEAGEMLEGRLDSIDRFRAAGVLVMGLTYNGTTPFGSGVLSPGATGITDLGRQAVGRMNASGVTLDLSHSDESTTLGAIEASARPVVITHAGCAAVHPHPRNKSDRLLRALADAGGVIGIYELSFLVAPPRQPGLGDYLTHIEHALSVCGEDHVAIGTDGLVLPFDTSPKSMRAWDAEVARRRAADVGAPGEGPPPFVIGLNRPDRYAVIADALRRRGHRSRIIDKVMGTNLERVFRQTWKAGR